MEEATHAPGRDANAESGGLIEREPLAVRPPYHVRDDSLRGLMLSDAAAWRRAVREDKLAALYEPLAGLEVSAYEQRILRWLAAGPCAPR